MWCAPSSPQCKTSSVWAQSCERAESNPSEMKESPGNAVSGHCSCSAAKLWVPKYSCRMGGDVQVCSGLKGLLGFNTSRRHLQPKALSLPCNPIWIVHGTGKRFPLVHHRSGGGCLGGKQISGTAIQCWKWGQCFVCAVTPVRSLLCTLAPEVKQGFWKQLWKGWVGGGEHRVRF